MEFLFKLKSVITGSDSRQAEDAVREKRFSPRIQCEVQSTCILGDGEEYSCVVTEIGLYGLRLQVARSAGVGQVVKVSAIKGVGILAGARYHTNTIKLKTVWEKRKKSGRDYMVGLQFMDSRKSLRDSWVAFLLKKYGVQVGLASQRRRKIRIPASLPLFLTASGEEEKVPARMLDIGLGGMLLAVEKDYPPEKELLFHIGPYKYFPPLTIKGMVLHVRFMPAYGKWVAGIIFQESDEDVLKLLTSYLTHLYFDKVEGGGKPPPAME